MQLRETRKCITCGGDFKTKTQSRRVNCSTECSKKYLYGR